MQIVADQRPRIAIARRNASRRDTQIRLDFARDEPVPIEQLFEQILFSGKPI
jgi:hypothetical protein